VIRNAYDILVRRPEGKRLLWRPRHKWGIILMWILKKYGVVMWTAFIWLRIGSSGGLLRIW